MITRELGPPGPAPGPEDESDPFGGYTSPADAVRAPLSDIAQPGSMAVGNQHWGIQRAGSAGGSAGHMGLDPGNPNTYTRPWNPTRGMFTRLHEEAGDGSDG